MESRDVAQRAIDASLRAGAESAEAIVEQGVHRLVRVSDGAIDFVKESRVRGVGLRIVVDGRRGFVHTSDLRVEGVDDLARRGVRLARLAPANPWAALPSSGFAPADDADLDLDLDDASIHELSAKELFDRAVRMERAALAADARIRRTQLCQTRHKPTPARRPW